VWGLGSIYSGIGSLFLWQFFITVVMFYCTLIFMVGIFTALRPRGTVFMKRHARLFLFITLFIASIISIPVTAKILGTPMDIGGLIIGLELNIVGGFTFALLYEVLVQKRLPWLSK